jgi:hypothetical protein
MPGDRKRSDKRRRQYGRLKHFRWLAFILKYLSALICRRTCWTSSDRGTRNSSALAIVTRIERTYHCYRRNAALAL